MNRAYSLLTVKAVDEDARIITGIATTPTADRLGDVVEPKGAQFKLPMPLLWQHTPDEPIGHVIKTKVTPAGIEIVAQLASIAEPGRLKDRLDEAWQSLKIGLVSGLSIGFKAVEREFNKDTNGIRFLKWLWLETSAVTIPANAEATISTVKSIDAAQRAAAGQVPHRVVRLNPPGSSGKPQSKAPQEGTDMTTVAERITLLENKRAASVAAMEAINKTVTDEDRTKNEAEKEEFAGLKAEVKSVDDELADARDMEVLMATKAKPVVPVATAEEGSAQRGGHIVVKTPQKLDPGIAFARVAKCIALSQKLYRDPTQIAADLYGPESVVVGALKGKIYGGDTAIVDSIKAAVSAGTTISGNWLANLVGTETGVFADFAEFLRPTTIVGRFGSGGIPGFRSVPFRTPLIAQTGGGSGYWVGQGAGKPLTSFTFERTTLEPLKVANIAVLTEESIRDTSPKADVIIRDALAGALRERIDTDFVDPANAGTSNIKPASITNGTPNLASSGTDADDVRLDLRTLLGLFNTANNPPDSAVLIMSMGNALALSFMVNALGQQEFPNMNMSGGVLRGLPVIASNYVGTNVIIVNASDIFFADDGDVSVDMSREASLEMSDAPAQSSATPTGASMVSMFQTNSVALRAERTLSWKRRRTSAVAYLEGVAWGGEVPTG